MKPTPKTHLRRDDEWTLCGKQQVLVRMLPRNKLVDEATCRNCQRLDDLKQVRDYRAECAASGLDPDTGEKISKETRIVH